MKGECTQTEAVMGLSEFLTSITGGLADFSVANLSIVLVAGLTAASTPVLAWFAYRFVKGKVVKALTRGKI